MTSRSRQIKREVRRRRRERLDELERNRKRLDQEIREARKGIADLNRQDIDLARGILRITLIALAVVIGLAIWIWAAEMQAQEVEAAVLRSHRITDGPLYSQQIPVVDPLPETPPEDGAPPEAIEIRTATKAEAVPEERWESLGKWKLTYYCHGRCCNGRNAGRTASGAPMTDGRTVAVGGLPFGTELMIDGHVYVVEDRGVRGNHVDILVSGHQKAKDLGVKYAEVFIKR